MKLATVLHLNFVTYLGAYVRAAPHGGRDLQDLLNPLSNLQITLRIPETPYSMTPWLPIVYIRRNKFHFECFTILLARKTPFCVAQRIIFRMRCSDWCS